MSDHTLTPVWKALADPSRRRILDLLRRRPHTTGELAEQFATSRFAVMKHLKVLEGAGLASCPAERECSKATPGAWAPSGGKPRLRRILQHLYERALYDPSWLGERVAPPLAFWRAFEIGELDFAEGGLDVASVTVNYQGYSLSSFVETPIREEQEWHRQGRSNVWLVRPQIQGIVSAFTDVKR